MTVIDGTPISFGHAAALFEPDESGGELLPHQKPPDGEAWDLWVLEGGRGCGKTHACARYFSDWMRDNPGSRGRIIAPTKDDAVDACVNGPSGIKSLDDLVEFWPSRAGGMTVEWPNGSTARVLGMDGPKDVTRLRAGGNRGIDWWEEMAHIPRLEKAWDMAQFGLRHGRRPHSIASTTPLASPDYQKIRDLAKTVITKATMYDNPHLADSFKEKMEALYEGTRLGKQELHGDLLEDVEGAFWSLEMLAKARWNKPLPMFETVVTSVDPSGSAAGDSTGIVTVAADAGGVPYVIADDTTKGSPEHRYRAAVMAAYRHQASVILFEDNYGGDNIASNLRSAWQAAQQRGDIPEDEECPSLKATTKLKPLLKGGKGDRAGVIAALYEQHLSGTERVWHVPGLALLEDQMTTWEEASGWSPDRLDAVVWGVRYHTRFLGRGDQKADVSAVQTYRRGFNTNGRSNGRSPFGRNGARIR